MTDGADRGMSGRAIVVGAGIGGLAVARALRADGWQVKVLEQTPGLPSAGTALGMWPEAMAALDRLGVGDDVRKQGVLQRGARFLRRDGTAFARIESTEPAYLISRPALHRILHDGALERSIEWSTRVEHLADLPVADLVIGADGINSRVRAAIAGDAPRPLGTVAFRGVVPGTAHGVTETWGDGRLFGVTPQDAGSINWFACVRDDLLAEHDAVLDDVELLTELYGHWHPLVAEVVARIRPEGVDRRALHDSAPIRSMVHRRTVVIGDAAHAMAPNAGRGACEALVDAVALADSLRASDGIDTRLRAFDRQRLKPGRRTVRVSRVLNRLSTGRNFAGARRAAMNALARLA